MKILIANDGPAAPYYIRLGQGNALRAAGHNVTLWNIKSKCAFDAFNEAEPDLFMGQTYNIDRAVFKCIAKRPEMKVVLFGSAYGDVVRQTDLNHFPIHVASENEIKTIEKLYRDTGKPNLIHIHCPPRHCNFVLGDWAANLGINISGIMNGADIFSYLGGKTRQEYVCDIGYIGGYWGYKSQSIRPILMKLIHKNKYRVKIFGNSNWNTPEYLGAMEEDNVKHFFASSLVNPSISEPHSLEFGYDITEKPFKVPLSGFLVADNVSGLKTDVFLNNECPTFNTSEELDELVSFYIKEENQSKRISMTKMQKATILNNHTYFHRCSKMMDDLNLPNESKQIMSVYEEIIKKYR